MIIHETKQENARSQVCHYWVEVYKNEEFFKHFEFRGYSGTEVHDVVKDLKREYPVSEGYEVIW